MNPKTPILRQCAFSCKKTEQCKCTIGFVCVFFPANLVFPLHFHLGVAVRLLLLDVHAGLDQRDLGLEQLGRERRVQLEPIRVLHARRVGALQQHLSARELHDVEMRSRVVETESKRVGKQDTWMGRMRTYARRDGKGHDNTSDSHMYKHKKTRNLQKRLKQPAGIHTHLGLRMRERDDVLLELLARDRGRLGDLLVGHRVRVIELQQDGHLVRRHDQLLDIVGGEADLDVRLAHVKAPLEAPPVERVQVELLEQLAPRAPTH
jgi:hypothetical protein